MRHFKAYELVDRKTYEQMGENALSLFTPQALRMLDDFREFFGVPIRVNDWYKGGKFQWRGWRTPAKCAMLGTPGSRHGKGEAFDLDVEDHTAQEVRQIVRINQDDPLLRHVMRMEDGVSWVHIDCMKTDKRIYFFRAKK